MADDLSVADLSMADLSMEDLSVADLSVADLDPPDLTATPEDLAQADISPAPDLSGEGADGGDDDVVLLLSEIQSRGSAGGNDEFIEIYNPNPFPVTFDSTWSVRARSAAGTLSACGGNATAVRFTGGGQVIPAHGHILYTNDAIGGYDGPVAGDGTYSMGITDGGSVMLFHGDNLVDAVCFFFNATSEQVVTSCTTAYVCKGAPRSNAPHTNNGTGNSNSDRSLERLPGGAAGNGKDTQSSVDDWLNDVEANPQNLASPPTP